ncbi:MAG: hypothetical protein KME44_08000 [Candidatus Thiodiazotropha sp. (ex Lucina pensylvanica)]|nr:hypothetical protein [Candidatus Thiodiazotropha sp. (ex Lucina pensylvanica)]
MSGDSVKYANQSPLGILMQGLIFPAVLGAGIVWFLSFLANMLEANAEGGFTIAILTDLRFYFSLWLLIYFCAPYLILAKEHYPNKYNVGVFLTDIGDVIVIFTAFYCLGLEPIHEIYYEGLYIAIGFIPILAFIGKLFSKQEKHLKLSASLLLLAIVMFFFGHNFQILNIIAVAILFFLLGVYFCVISKLWESA